MLWLALHQTTHSSQDQKGLFPFIHYQRTETLEATRIKKQLKKNPNKQPKKPQAKPSPRCAISRRPFCSLWQFRLFPTPAGHWKQRSSHPHLHSPESLRWHLQIS